MSPTLAELYFNQGFTDKAIEGYRQLLERDPGNERFRRRIAELQGTALAGGPSPVSPQPATLRAGAAEPALPGPGADSRRVVLERTIARLEGMLAVIKKG